jgi:phosphomannomutase/phosphoglucomutase
VAFVDNEGAALTAEQATFVLLWSFDDALKGQTFVHDVKFSDRVAHAAREMGAAPVAERSGHAFIRTRMLETGALFGAEISGHFFYRGLQGGDDGLFTACRMMADLARRTETLAELRGHCPQVHMTPDLRLSAGKRSREEIIDRIRAVFGEYPQSSVDGVRIDFPDGWALVRGSVTERRLTFRFEGNSGECLDRIVRDFAGRLPDLGEELIEQYEEG